MIKKITSILIAIVLTFTGAGVWGTTVVRAESSSSGSGNKLKIVATIFPEYDWTREILGDRLKDVDLTLLLDNGTDLHSFQPAVKDIMRVSSCDLLIYVGGESDQWIEDALKSAANPDMKTINLMETLKDFIKEEETVEGMQEKHHSHEEDEKEYDEHVWTSLRNASAAAEVIADTLAELDPENSDIYKENLRSYQGELSSLDNEYQKTVDQSTHKTLLFADRFPFRYLVDDYGISYYAAFSGCSAESEASFKTITFLAKKVDELGLKEVFTIEKSDDRIAETVIENTRDKDQKVAVLNSMQSITSEEIADGTTYLSIMEDNLKVLKAALK